MDYLAPSTLKPAELFKTFQITSLDGFRWWFRYSNNGFTTVTAVLSFCFLFILAESLKNDSKS